MEYRIKESNITDSDIEDKIECRTNFEVIDKNKQYDVEAEFYNPDLADYSLNEDVPYEIKKEHIRFSRALRNVFERNGVQVNRLCVMGTAVNLNKGEINILYKKSELNNLKENTIWPCREIFMYEDVKTTLELLLFTNQISDEEYKLNLENLQDELSIYENDEDFGYLN